MIITLAIGAVMCLSVFGGILSIMTRAESYVHYMRTSWVFVPLLLAVSFFVFVVPNLKKITSKKRASAITLTGTSFLVGSLFIGFILTKKTKQNNPIYELSGKLEKGKKVGFNDMKKAKICINSRNDHSLHELIALNDPTLLPVIKYLVKHGNTDYINAIYSGDTPLSLAVRLNNIKAIKLLISRRDLDIQKIPAARALSYRRLLFSVNFAPIDLAMRCGNFEVTQVLYNEYKRRNIELKQLQIYHYKNLKKRQSNEK